MSGGVKLTDPQHAVLRALDKLPDGEFARPSKATFNAQAAWALYWGVKSRGFGRGNLEWGYGPDRRFYRLTPAGRALVARLKAEGKL